MLSILLTNPSGQRTRFYRVDVDYNLFGEYAVIREWGLRGKKGTRLLLWFSNLREACLAADRYQKRAYRRGYRTFEGQNA